MLTSARNSQLEFGVWCQWPASKIASNTVDTIIAEQTTHLQTSLVQASSSREHKSNPRPQLVDVNHISYWIRTYDHDHRQQPSVYQLHPPKKNIWWLQLRFFADHGWLKHEKTWWNCAAPGSPTKVVPAPQVAQSQEHLTPRRSDAMCYPGHWDVGWLPDVSLKGLYPQLWQFS